MNSTQAAMVYPPVEKCSEIENYYSHEVLAAVLEPFGGLKHFIGRAAYFRFENDFQGFMRESLEVFDYHYMPYFSENTVTFAQYELAKENFSKALIDICNDITYITTSYVGKMTFKNVEVVASNPNTNTLIIFLK